MGKPVVLIRKEIQWPYALAQLGETMEILSVSLKLEHHTMTPEDGVVRIRVEASVRIGMETLRSMTGHLSLNGKVFREGRLAAVFDGDVAGIEHTFIDQVDEMVMIILKSKER